MLKGVELKTTKQYHAPFSEHQRQLQTWQSVIDSPRDEHRELMHVKFWDIHDELYMLHRLH